jgi:HEAT repeat protein
MAAPSKRALKDQRSRIIGLALTGTDRDVPQLREALASPDRETRTSATIALGRIGTARSIDALIDSLKVADSGVLMVAAHELVRLGEVRAIPALELTLIERGDELDSPIGKQALVATLGGFAQRSSVPALAGRLTDADRVTRKRAANALRRINYPESRAALEQASRELSYWRGRWVRRALRSMKRRLAE